jgi:cobalt/nickel transport system permease protein
MDRGWIWVIPPLLLCLAGAVLKACRHRGEPRHHHQGWGHKHGEATLSIDIYAYMSKISGWNPGFKVGLSVILLLMCVIANNMVVSLSVILITSTVTVVLGDMSLHHYLNLLTVPIVFLVAGSIMVLINFSWTPVAGAVANLNCHWFTIYITATSVHTTLLLWGRAFGAVCAMYMMSLSTMSGEIFSVLRRCHVPKLVIELMNMMYRYIFIMLDTQSRMKNSAQSRLGYCDFKTSIYSFGQSMGNLLIVSMKRGSQFYDAMESRGYDGDLVFLEEEKPLDKKMLLAAGLVISYLAFVWFVTTRGAGYYG